MLSAGIDLRIAAVQTGVALELSCGSLNLNLLIYVSDVNHKSRGRHNDPELDTLTNCTVVVEKQYYTLVELISSGSAVYLLHSQASMSSHTCLNTDSCTVDGSKNMLRIAFMSSNAVSLLHEKCSLICLVKHALS